MSKEVLVVCGPTAAGKTKISIELAIRLDGEIVSCDSMQIYQYMEIGSACPSPEELAAVPHHLIGIISPGEHFSVARYGKMARKAISGILSKGKVPIVTGGTGLYLNALLYDMDFAGTPGDESVRSKYEQMAEQFGNQGLHNLLARRSPQTAERIHPNNLKRVVRALETLEITGKTPDAFEKVTRPVTEYLPRLAGIYCEREALCRRIDRRVDEMFEKGLVEEVRRLLNMGVPIKSPAMMGIGYKELVDCIQGNGSISDAKDQIKLNTRQLAKRQMTWFRRYQDLEWFDLTDENDYSDVVEKILAWYRGKK